MPNVGEPAPDFSLAASDGQTYSLSQFRGKKHVVLVFYPGDDTPVCTAQLCDYRDGWEDFQQLDAVILGISTNDMTAHKKFAEKFSFPFPLLEDRSPSRGLGDVYKRQFKRCGKSPPRNQRLLLGNSTEECPGTVARHGLEQ